MDAANISADERRRAWRDELRSTLALAWPLILANVTQQAIVATDVLLMSRLGPLALAASALALNFTYTLNMLLMGLVIASSPMMATALGRRSNSVRDVRRTFRAGLWILIFALPLYWLVLWNIGAILIALGQDPQLAAMGQSFLRAYMWCTAPWLLFTLMRNFISALERPRAVFVLSAAGIGNQRVDQLGADFRPPWVPRARHGRRRPRQYGHLVDLMRIARALRSSRSPVRAVPSVRKMVAG